MGRDRGGERKGGDERTNEIGKRNGGRGELGGEGEVAKEDRPLGVSLAMIFTS